MTTFLLCWYALGWASVGIWLTGMPVLSACKLFWMLIYGGLSFLGSAIIWFENKKVSCLIIWRKKP